MLFGKLQRKLAKREGRPSIEDGSLEASRLALDIYIQVRNIAYVDMDKRKTRYWEARAG